jgi:hypothetical protein
MTVLVQRGEVNALDAGEEPRAIQHVKAPVKADA